MLATALRERGRAVELLDGDVVRDHLSPHLGFSRADRDENVRRIGFVARLLSRNGVCALTAAISPYRAAREEVRRSLATDGCGFVEVYVACPLSVLRERDVKGLYRRALDGDLPAFTGVSDPYEEPLSPEVVVHSDRQTPAESLAQILAGLERLGHLR
jgi:adenylyl-sulfate kinase